MVRLQVSLTGHLLAIRDRCMARARSGRAANGPALVAGPRPACFSFQVSGRRLAGSNSACWGPTRVRRPGFLWELDQVRQHVEPFRVLLCVVSFWRDPQAYEEWTAAAKNSLKVDLPRVVPFLDRPAFIYFERDWVPRLQELSYRCPALWPLTADAADLRYSLQPFLEGMFGGDREPPRRPRWTGGFRTFATICAAIVISLVVLLAPVLGIRWAMKAVFGPAVIATSAERQIPYLVARSARMPLRGRDVAYEVMVPEALLEMHEDQPFGWHGTASAGADSGCRRGWRDPRVGP
jgi:hypothetical protein